MPDWFAGVAEDLAAEVYDASRLRPTYELIIPALADDAVLGIRLIPRTPETPPPPLTYARDWVAEFDRAHQHGTQEWVDREIRRRRDAQERRDRNTAMVLWGIHL